MRIAITGVPRGGKSSTAKLLSALLDIPRTSTDDVIHLDWSAGSEEVSKWFSRPSPWIIEGVVIPRALRKWKVAREAIEEMLDPSLRRPVDPPFDKILVIRYPRETLNQGQNIMGKQVLGLIDTYRDWIGDRWIEI